jgi:hypothetical protein
LEISILQASLLLKSILALQPAHMIQTKNSSLLYRQSSKSLSINQYY